jgi:hypothetical protein
MLISYFKVCGGDRGARGGSGGGGGYKVDDGFNIEHSGTHYED